MFLWINSVCGVCYLLWMLLLLDVEHLWLFKVIMIFLLQKLNWSIVPISFNKMAKFSDEKYVLPKIRKIYLYNRNYYRMLNAKIFYKEIVTNITVSYDLYVKVYWNWSISSFKTQIIDFLQDFKCLEVRRSQSTLKVCL